MSCDCIRGTSSMRIIFFLPVQIAADMQKSTIFVDM
jgi:hypothetical protein